MDVLLLEGAPEARRSSLALAKHRRADQQLPEQIWWTHKRVCGKAKWEWPHFSEKEQDFVRFSIQKDFTSPWGQRGNLLDIIQPIAGDKNAFEVSFLRPIFS